MAHLAGAPGTPRDETLETGITGEPQFFVLTEIPE